MVFAQPQSECPSTRTAPSALNAQLTLPLQDLSESVSLMSHHIRKLCLTLPDAGPNLKRHLEKAGEHARRAHSKLHLDPPLASAARSVSVGASLTDELGCVAGGRLVAFVPLLIVMQ